MGLDHIKKLKREAEERVPSKYGPRKVSLKNQRKAEEVEALMKKDDEFLKEEVWAKREHVCFECGVSLGDKYKKWFCHHTVEKSDYPDYRYLVENILLLCLIHHDQAGSDLDKVPKTKGYTEGLKTKLGL